MQNPVIQWIGTHPWWTAIAFVYFWNQLFWGSSIGQLNRRLKVIIWVILRRLDDRERLPKLCELAAHRGVDPGVLLDVMLDEYEVVIDQVEFPEKTATSSTRDARKTP